jgi:thiopurine S-methyltransferase
MRSFTAAAVPCRKVSRRCASSSVLSTPAADLRYWQDLWHEGGDVFTLDAVNENLKAHLAELLPPLQTKPDAQDPRSVLVPLCGRSIDMAFLAQRQKRVLGVDVSWLALQQFATAHGEGGGGASDAAHAGAPGKLLRCRSLPSLTLLQADFLALRPEQCGGAFDAAWDRGGLTSVPPALRPVYVTTLWRFLRPGGRLLLEFLTSSSTRAAESGSLTTAAALALFQRPTQLPLRGEDHEDEAAAAPPVWSARQLSCKDVRGDYPAFDGGGASLDEIVLVAEKLPAPAAATRGAARD